VKDKILSELKVLENPFREEAKRKGIMVAEWLGEQQVNKVFVKESLKKGPMYTFDSFYIQVIETKHELLKDIIIEIGEKKVP